MNDKIKQFLENAGFSVDADEPATLQLLRYFEAEYGVNLLALLEQEWLDEQLNADMDHYDFEVLREFLDEGHQVKFDEVVAEIAAIV